VHSHENHVATEHSAWLVPVQLAAIERSADPSRGERKRKRENRERERERERVIESEEAGTEKEGKEKLATLAEWLTRTN